jgi:hypothetical protein
MAVAGEVMARIRLGQIPEAKPFIAEAGRQAEADRRWVKWTQAHLFASDIAVAEGHREQTIQS